MGRLRRPLVAGSYYHVAARGNRQELIFLDAVHRERLLKYLGEEAALRDWCCLAYCVVGNHYHLFVRTPEPNLSDGMHRLNLRYARWFNDLHDVVGHTFHHPFRARLVQDEGHALWLFRYIARNPVEAGLCRMPSEWKWSSYRELVGSTNDRGILDRRAVLEFFGAPRFDGLQRLIAYVDG